MSFRRLGLLGGAAILATAFATPALAQEEPTAAPPTPGEPGPTQPAPAPDAPEPVSGEIIVTARRLAESLQDVPATIQVFTEETLINAGIDTTEDFVALTPGVTIVTGTAEVGDTQINIRGLNGARDAEPSVALVVDGILKTNTAALNQDQGDLVQVEILKGPQGALYGRNAAAGALVLQTRRPGDRIAGRLKASYAENDTYQLFGSVSGPLTDTVGLLVSGDFRHSDGQFEIEAPVESDGQYVDRFEAWNVNARLMIEPTDALTIDAKARYGEIDAGSIVFNAAFALPNFAAIDPLFYEDVNERDFAFQPNIAPDNDQETVEASLKLDYDLGPVTLTAWGAYSDIDQNFIADGTSAAFGFFNADAPCRESVAQLNAAGVQLPRPQVLGQVPDSNLFVPNGSLLGAYTPTLCDGTQYQVRNQRDWSGELRLAGTALEERLQWLVGGYYLDLEREVGVNLGIDRGQGVIRELFTTDPANPTEQLVHDRFDTRVWAVFGSADIDLTDTLSASVALRYDNEKREVTNLVPPDARTIYVDFDGVPFTGGAPLNPGLLFGPIGPQERTFDQWQPKVSLRWEPSPYTTLFANYGIGFKSGGFNNQGSRATIDINFNQTIGANVNIEDTFRKEVSNAFEAGFKAETPNGAFNVEGALYYTNVEDLQFFEFFVGTFGLLRVVSNIDEVEIYGGELAANVRLVEGFTAFGSVNVTESEIKENRARPDTVGNESPYTSDFTINLGSQIEAPLTPDLELLFRTDVRIVGPTWFSTVQDQDRPTLFTAILPLAGLPAELGTANYTRTERETFTTVNLRAGLEGEGWSAAVFATNLLNEEYLEEVIPAPEFGGAFISPGMRRRVGVEVNFSF